MDKGQTSQAMQDAGVDESLAKLAADILDKKQQGKELSDKQEKALYAAQKQAGDDLDINSLVQGEPQAVEDKNVDKRQASQAMQDAGVDESLAKLAADILDKKQQGKELSDKQEKALYAAQKQAGDDLDINSLVQGEPQAVEDKNVDKRQASQAMQDAGVDESLAKLAADILDKKQQGKELSDKQEKALYAAQKQAGDDLDINSLVQGESQEPERDEDEQAFIEGQTKIYEKAGLEAEKSQEAATLMNKQFGQQPLSSEEKSLVNEAEATVHESIANKIAERKEIASVMVSNAQDFLKFAKQEGIAQQSGSSTTVEGNNYDLTQIDDRLAIHNKETGAEVIADSDEIIKAEGVTQEDLENWQKVGEIAQKQQQSKAASVEREKEEEEMEL
ncbi:hypothetical protein IQ258_01015 [Coleofasciculus sp. LEGE 07081]|uniref:hypothetical protein n=1 Tax=Coleofasciculus sp. LEGE 07081 TaxID=2777967 RepID=UPI00188241CC|nr:hypothetical protein [Coleofasciculus sp. LEGE 07081]MBE9124771.1 hypothetical protein [Coleofasciculus sp. LEGE 07081]